MDIFVPQNKKGFVSEAFTLACAQFESLGVQPESALQRLSQVSLSLPCWQGDDVVGFESKAPRSPSGGIAVTGTYPGRARCPEELRSDLQLALRLLPGSHRVNLHASYADFQGAPVDRDALEPAHFRTWVDWALSLKIGLDFNPTFFGHFLSGDGYTLAHQDPAIRRFWIEHARRCRQIGHTLGAALGSPCVTNLWIPDGSKDSPADRNAPRERLRESLDTLFDPPLEHCIDALEPKLFGLGSESYVVGSYDFYLAYALRRDLTLCLDSGHFHPTENVSDKLSSLLQFLPSLLLHLSRGIRWDSDHVVTETDQLLELTREIVAHGWERRVHLGLDFFDASINRIAAWVIGARATQKALLRGLLEPTEALKRLENEGDFTQRLALQEECRTLPYGAVWNEFCRRNDVPLGLQWLQEVRDYEARVLSKRA